MVADKFQMSRPTISQIEAGKRPVNGLELRRFAKLYGVSVERLLQETDDRASTDEDTYFQSIEPPGDIPEARSGVRSALYDFVEHCHQHARLERLLFNHIRDLSVRYTPDDLGDDPVSQGKAAAAQERKRLGLGYMPVMNLPEVLEHQHVKVIVESRPDASHLVGAAICREQFGPAIFVNVAGACYAPGRLNFTAAHEYAHLLLDKELDNVDYDTFLQDARPFERRANAFAAAFLMPAEGVWAELRAIGWRERDVIGQTEAMYLSVRFGVSYRAIVWRLCNLGLITPDIKGSLTEQPVNEAWAELGLAASVQQALEQWSSFRQRGRFRMLVFQAYRHGLISAADGAKLLGLQPATFELHLHRGTSGAYQERSPKRSPEMCTGTSPRGPSESSSTHPPEIGVPCIRTPQRRPTPCCDE